MARRYFHLGRFCGGLFVLHWISSVARKLHDSSAPRQRLKFPLLLLAGILLVSNIGNAIAETVIVDAADGIDGEQGASGDPGLPGGDGQDGSSATATADALLEDNTAIANGGSGGDGGWGGRGVARSPGADGGDGGGGANGGDAVANASTIGANLVRATATGGSGGNGGRGGDGTGLGVDGEWGQITGNGGDATASATIEQNFEGGGPSVGVDGEAFASGGRGFSGSSFGGNARASLTGEASGAGSPETSHVLKATARGSHAGVRGGDAQADATGSTSHGSLSVTAFAEAGTGSGLQNEGGDAVAVATGSHSGSGELNVSAVGIIGDGYAGFNAGTAVLSASGIATGGADVNVSVLLQGGRDTELRNAVSGSTSGVLSLLQGQVGLGPAVATSFGVTRTSLVSENTGGGHLEMRVFTNAVRFSGEDPDSGSVILGDVIGRSNAGSDVDILVNAAGEHVRQQDLDDPSRASRILGISNGGDVSVRADFKVRTAPTTIDGLHVLGGDGYSAVMQDAVGGETFGNLVLSQNTTAGSASDLPYGLIFQPGTIAIAGSGGEAINQLGSAGAFESLSFEGSSHGGDGGGGPLVVHAGDGGAAMLSRDATNDSGGITIQGYARGGRGGRSDVISGVGGDAFVDIHAATFGDGHAIVIGQEPAPRIRQGARAGDGGGFFSTVSPPTTTTGDGGRAESRSAGVAHGDSAVDVYDFAVGGWNGGLGSWPPVAGFAGRGGDAVSGASAIGGGMSRTAARADATGGRSGFNATSGSHAGEAEAAAYAAGLGEAEAFAIATGGSIHSGDSPAGSARAAAETSGTANIATADAATGGGSAASFRALVRQETTERTRVEATAAYATAFPNDSAGNKGSAFIAGRPLAEDIGYAMRSHSGLAAMLSETPSASVEALGRWSASGRGQEPTTQLVELDITLAPPEGPAELVLAVFNLDASGGGFESLAFRLEVFGVLFGEEVVFDNLSEAKAYFASVIVIGEAFLESFRARGVPAVRAIFESTLSGGQEVSFGLAAAVVPEPSTALLLGIGLFLVAFRGQPDRRLVSLPC